MCIHTSARYFLYRINTSQNFNDRVKRFSYSSVAITSDNILMISLEHVYSYVATQASTDTPVHVEVLIM